MRTAYRIVVRGELEGFLAGAFQDLQPERDSGQTVLSVDLDDQAQLQAIFERLRDFGIDLVAVRSEPADPARAHPGAETRPG